MNVNYGLFPPLLSKTRAVRGSGRHKKRKRERNERLAQRALASLVDYLHCVEPADCLEPADCVESTEPR
jgi:folate-dependent tRNA-U54 methylase TrmFO/GidA